MSSPDLLRVLVNLGVNALQASDQPHRVEIDTWSLQEPVDLLALNHRAPGILIGQETFLNRTPLVAVAVRDNGPGISPEILPRLFNSIVSTKDDRSGTGLGLTVVRRAVVEAGGALHLRTQPGRGTSFTLFLPG
jgi:signal transduction histidine kinase